MYQSKRFSLALISLFVLGITFSIGFKSGLSGASAQGQVLGVTNMKAGMPENVDFAAFWKAWSILNDKFAGTSTTDQQKVYGAISGLTSSLGDPYTVFFPPEESKVFASEIAGNFEGVGMEMGIKDGKLVVVAPIKDAPAEKAGVRAGDFIVKVDDRDSLTFSTDEAVKLIRGKAGTKVKLTVAREGVKTPIEISITRAQIDIPTVKTTTKRSLASTDTSDTVGLRKDGIFVISLYSFSANSANLFRNALKEFIDSGSHKLIVDLRGNPGGYLEAAVDMASWFLSSDKVIVKEEFGKGREGQMYKSKGYDIFNKSLKMVVLVDGGSASASEILAGALSENGVATLVGAKTFGKGSVQELVNLTSDTSLKVTIAKWLTPNGHSISKQGITPDYVVPMTADDVKNQKDPQMDKAVELLSKEK
ncbi:MAG: carboxy-terminal-processing protease, carboxyl-terminal processing protease [Candidatus Parcubacteria bacterium]